MDYTELDRQCVKIGCELLSQEPMSRHTSFKLGGNADRFLIIPTKQALVSVLACLQKGAIPYFVLGNGSNLLVSDLGIRGAVLCLAGEFKEMELCNSTTIRCGAGVRLASLCNFAKKKGLSGLEFAFGIPGTAGGAAYMNAGAYGGEMKDVLVACRHISPTGVPGEFTGEELGLAYRKSAYTDGNNIITELIFKLQKGNPDRISQKMEELMGKRREKQPLEYPSAGSTFKRPEGYFAAALIEECGLKGRRVGGAEVSKKHSGFVVNTGNATCAQVLELIDTVKKEVYRQKQITLECEIKWIGE